MLSGEGQAGVEASASTIEHIENTEQEHGLRPQHRTEMKLGICITYYIDESKE